MACIDSDDPATSPASLKASLLSRVPQLKARATQLLNDAAFDFFRDSDRWRETLTLSVPADSNQLEVNQPTGSYTINKIIDVFAKEPSIADSAWLPLSQVRGNTSLPQQIMSWHSPHNRSVLLSANVLAALELRIEVSYRPIAPDWSCEQSLLQEYRETIIARAMHLAMLSHIDETRDMPRTNDHQARYLEGLAEARRFYAMDVDSTRPHTSSRLVQLGRQSPAFRHPDGIEHT